MKKKHKKQQFIPPMSKTTKTTTKTKITHQPTTTTDHIDTPTWQNTKQEQPIKNVTPYPQPHPKSSSVTEGSARLSIKPARSQRV